LEVVGDDEHSNLPEAADLVPEAIEIQTYDGAFQVTGG